MIWTNIWTLKESSDFDARCRLRYFSHSMPGADRRGGLLQKLYGRVLIPEAVYAELQQQHTPVVVRDWVKVAPAWVEVVPSTGFSTVNLVSFSLDSGEGQAIALALDLKADLLLMDERAGVDEARRLGLTATGTLESLLAVRNAASSDSITHSRNCGRPISVLARRFFKNS